MNRFGANTWIWVSPLTDERLTQLAPRVRDMGFDVVELPIEQLGDWSPEHAAEVLTEHGLGYHPLWDQGYVSVGDWHSTSKLLDGMKEEDTRFGGLKRECGLHETSGKGDFQI